MVLYCPTFTYMKVQYFDKLILFTKGNSLSLPRKYYNLGFVHKLYINTNYCRLDVNFCTFGTIISLSVKQREGNRRAILCMRWFLSYCPSQNGGILLSILHTILLALFTQNCACVIVLTSFNRHNNTMCRGSRTHDKILHGPLISFFILSRG